MSALQITAASSARKPKPIPPRVNSLFFSPRARTTMNSKTANPMNGIAHALG